MHEFKLQSLSNGLLLGRQNYFKEKKCTQNKHIRFLVILTKASMYFLIETIKQALGKKI